MYGININIDIIKIANKYLKEKKMAKNMIIALIGVVCMAFVSNVYAQNVADLKITNRSGEEQSSFSFSEIPWIEVVLKTDDGTLDGWWKQPSEGGFDILQEHSGVFKGATVRYSLSDWDWPSIQSAGKYSVHLDGYGTQFVSVTPEPISCVLFLIGGGALTFFRKKIKI